MSMNRLSDLTNTTAQSGHWDGASMAQAAAQARCPQCNIPLYMNDPRYPPHLPTCTYEAEQNKAAQNVGWYK